MNAVRVTRVLIDNFRGWEHLDLQPRGHVVLAGVPRSGRSDLITALRRVLDPDSTRAARPTDIYQTTTVAAAADDPDDAAGQPRRTNAAEVEVTLADLDPEGQQLCDGFLEPLDATGQVSEADDVDPTAPHGVRMTYRLSYDADADVLDGFVYYPVRSDPAMAQYSRVPTATRRALPVLTLSSAQPLQLRAGGGLRRILDARDPDAATAAFTALTSSMGTAVSALAQDTAIAGAVEQILASGGAGARLGDTPLTSADVSFAAEDGTVGALLRTLQPALRLDHAGPLPLPSHGSTAAAVLSVAEAMLLANLPSAIVLTDDFGDQLDAAAAEHLAGLLRGRSGQVWLSTRRPEAARAFAPTELIRLTRHGDVRQHHQLGRAVDRKTLAAMRQLHTQLLTAISAPTVAITEGPHDVAVYAMVDRHYPPHDLPLSAHGVRLVAAGTGQDGGIDKIPHIATLAGALGFRVVALIDHDKPSPQSDQQITRVEAACDLVVRLPRGAAIERALLAGISVNHITAASATLTDYGVPDPAAGRAGEDAVMEVCKVVHKQGLHEQLLEALYENTGTHPPLIRKVLDQVAKFTNTPPSATTTMIDIPDVARPTA